MFQLSKKVCACKRWMGRERLGSIMLCSVALTLVACDRGRALPDETDRNSSEVKTPLTNVKKSESALMSRHYKDALDELELLRITVQQQPKNVTALRRSSDRLKRALMMLADPGKMSVEDDDRTGPELTTAGSDAHPSATYVTPHDEDTKATTATSDQELKQRQEYLEKTYRATPPLHGRDGDDKIVWQDLSPEWVTQQAKRALREVAQLETQLDADAVDPERVQLTLRRISREVKSLPKPPRDQPPMPAPTTPAQHND